MKNFIKAILIFAACFFMQYCTKSQQNKVLDMDGWFKAGSKPGFYEIGIADETYNDKAVYFIKSTENFVNGFGTIMKNIKPDSFINNRIRMTAFIRTEDTREGAGMWMRVDGYWPGLELGFENMGNRLIKGTLD